jgi:hypothetical protein
MASRTYYVGSGPGIKVLQNVTSGGTSWNTLPFTGSFSNNPYLLDVKTDPLSANKVFIVGTYTAPVGNFKGIAVSNDGGLNWTTPVGNWDTAVITAAVLNPSNTLNINEVWVTDSNNIYVCADKGLIFKSSDGGLSFNTLSALPASLGTVDVTSLHFPYPGRGIVGVTDSTGKGYVVQTSNDGVFWYVLNSTNTLEDSSSNNIGTVKSVYLNTVDNLVVACGDKKIFKSTLTSFTSFTDVFSWPGNNGRHLTWYETGANRKFWAVGAGEHIISTTDDFTTIVTIRPYQVPPAICSPLARPQRMNYNGAHFYNTNAGFYAVSSCDYGVTFATTPASYTSPGNNALDFTAVNAVWTHIIPPLCYTLTNCITGQSYVTPYDISSYVGQIVTFSIPNQQTDTIQSIAGCFLVGTVPVTPGSDEACPGSIPVVNITGTYPNCTYCTTNCFNLVNCDPDKPDDVIVVPITETYFSSILDKYVKISSCSDCYKVVLSTSCYINPDSVDIDYTSLVTDVYDTCQLCQGTAVPTPFVLHQRRVKPGFYTPGCPPDYTVKTSCMYAEQLYDEMVAVRYGITICCDHDIDKWDIKKQLLDLNAIYDPTLCTSSVVDCLPPCNVDASVSVPQLPVPPCAEPDDVTGVLTIDDPCPSPEPPVVVPTLGFGPAPDGLCYISIFSSDRTPIFMTSITVNGNVIDLTSGPSIINVTMQSPLWPGQFISAMAAAGYYVSGAGISGTQAQWILVISYFAGGVPQSFTHNGPPTTSEFISAIPCNA